MSGGSEPGRMAVAERMGLRIVALLLVVAALSVSVLWSVNPVGSGAESTFALYLGVDLVSLAMISYVERAITRDSHLARAPLVAGCCFIVFLVVSGLYLA